MAGAEVWHTVYSMDAVERQAVADGDALVRFLCMLRLRRPAVLVVAADLAAGLRQVLVGDECVVLTAGREAVLEIETLDRLEQGVLDALAATHHGQGRMEQGRVRLVLLAVGSTAGVILQKRLLVRLFGRAEPSGHPLASPAGAAGAASGAQGAARSPVFLVDVTPAAEAVAGGAPGSPELLSAGRGFTLGDWQRNSGMQAGELRERLQEAVRARDKVVVLVATALVHKEEDVWNRSALYCDTFRTLARLGYPRPLIVEAVDGGEKGSMLEQYGEVVYTRINEARYHGNQGANEARSLLVGLEQLEVAEDVMVLKLTGRYTFVDRSLLLLLEANAPTGSLDGVLSVAQHKSLVFTGCFALRAGLLRRALQGCDWSAVSHAGVHLEFLLLHKVQETCGSADCRIIRVPRLGVAARRADSLEAVVW